MLAPVILALFLLRSAYAAIGPVADLHIVNSQIAPDGYKRMYGFFVAMSYSLGCGIETLVARAVLAGSSPHTATFPGPLIIGNKVRHLGRMHGGRERS